MTYTTVFFVLSCAVAMTYMWLIPYVTQFTSPWHRKFQVFPFNSTVFHHLEVYDDKGCKEYLVHITSQNCSCLAFVYTDGHSQWMKFSSVNTTFSFRTSESNTRAIKLECENDTVFIFHRTDEYLVYPLLRKSKETYVCPADVSCTFDISPFLQRILSEKESVRGLRIFCISNGTVHLELNEVL